MVFHSTTDTIGSLSCLPTGAYLFGEKSLTQELENGNSESVRSDLHHFFRLHCICTAVCKGGVQTIVHPYRKSAVNHSIFKELQAICMVLRPHPWPSTSYSASSSSILLCVALNLARVKFSKGRLEDVTRACNLPVFSGCFLHLWSRQLSVLPSAL